MDISKLSYSELIELEELVKAKKKEFKPFRIKRVYRRCGVEGCYCVCGPADNEWGNMHGPYLYSTWRENGKTKTASLGREYSADEIEKLQDVEHPRWYDDDFIISEKQFQRMSDDRKWEVYERSLSDEDFEAKYGMSPLEDKIGRPRKLRYDHRKYDARMEEIKGLVEVAFSEWSKRGIGTHKGLKVLQDLEKRNYYFKL